MAKQRQWTFLSWNVNGIRAAEKKGFLNWLVESKADVIASSFDPRVLAWFASRAPRIRRAWLVNVTQRQIARSIRAFARRGAFHAVHLERRLASPDRIRLLHDRGLRVGVWTVDDPREARDLFEVGVDWIVTDWPAAMV